MSSIENLISQGSIEDISNTLKSIDLNESVSNIDEDYPIHLAVKANRPYVVQLLIDNGASTVVRNEDYDTPLKLAKSIDVVRAIMNAPDRQGRDSSGELTYVLSNAVSNKDINFARNLIAEYPFLGETKYAQGLISTPIQSRGLSRQEIIDTLVKIANMKDVSTETVRTLLNNLDNPSESLLSTISNNTEIAKVIIQSKIILTDDLLRKFISMGLTDELLKRPREELNIGVIGEQLFNMNNFDLLQRLLSHIYNCNVSMGLAILLRSYDFDLRKAYYSFFLHDSTVENACYILSKIAIDPRLSMEYINQIGAEPLIAVWGKSAIEINDFKRNPNSTTLLNLNNTLGTDMNLSQAINYVSDYTVNLNNIIQGAPRHNDSTILMRGVSADFPKVHVGQIIPITEITATTQDLSTAEEFNEKGYIFRIYVPKNYPLLYAGHITGHISEYGFNEILLGFGNLQVINIIGNNVVLKVI